MDRIDEGIPQEKIDEIVYGSLPVRDMKTAKQHMASAFALELQATIASIVDPVKAEELHREAERELSVIE